MASVELETVQWDRIDSVFEEEESSVPHYNYRIQSKPRETRGSSNLEAFVEEEQEVIEGASRSESSSIPAINGVDQEEVDGSRFREYSSGSTSSCGQKCDSSLREYY